MNDRRYYLGIDAGGTKTHAVIADQTGRIWSAGRAGRGNWESIGLEQATRALASALDDALKEAGLQVADLSGAGYGLAGVDWPSDEVRLLPYIQQLAVPGPHVLVNDAYVAFRAGSDEGCGVAVISGTGVAVAGRNRQGRLFRTLALGNEWGDFGSSYDLVVRATRAIAHAHTGRGSSTLLTQRFLEAFHARDVPDMVERIARGQARPLNGRLAPLVFTTAAEGDAVAQEVLIYAGKELGQNALAVAGRLDLLSEPFDLVLAGGVFRDTCTLFRDALVEQVRSSAPAVRPVPLLAAPAIGGVLLAMDAAGEQAGAQVRQRLEREAADRPVLSS